MRVAVLKEGVGIGGMVGAELAALSRERETVGGGGGEGMALNVCLQLCCHLSLEWTQWATQHMRHLRRFVCFFHCRVPHHLHRRLLVERSGSDRSSLEIVVPGVQRQLLALHSGIVALQDATDEGGFAPSLELVGEHLLLLLLELASKVGREGGIDEFLFEELGFRRGHLIRMGL